MAGRKELCFGLSFNAGDVLTFGSVFKLLLLKFRITFCVRLYSRDGLAWLSDEYACVVTSKIGPTVVDAINCC